MDRPPIYSPKAETQAGCLTLYPSVRTPQLSKALFSLFPVPSLLSLLPLSYPFSPSLWQTELVDNFEKGVREVKETMRRIMIALPQRMVKLLLAPWLMGSSLAKVQSCRRSTCQWPMGAFLRLAAARGCSRNFLEATTLSSPASTPTGRCSREQCSEATRSFTRPLQQRWRRLLMEALITW
ncbi:unnamed protein product [Chrysoparadoxa australica]